MTADQTPAEPQALSVEEEADGRFYILFSEPPGPVSQFVEVETWVGHSVGPEMTGAYWEQRPDGLWALGPFGRHQFATRESAGAGLDVRALWQQTTDEIERLERDWARLSGDYPRTTSVVPIREVRTALIGIAEVLRLAAAHLPVAEEEKE